LAFILAHGRPFWRLKPIVNFVLPWLNGNAAAFPSKRPAMLRKPMALALLQMGRVETTKQDTPEPLRLLNVRDTTALLAVNPRILQHMVQRKELPMTAVFCATFMSTAIASGLFLLFVGPLVLFWSWH